MAPDTALLVLCDAQRRRLLRQLVTGQDRPHVAPVCAPAIPKHRVSRKRLLSARIIAEHGTMRSYRYCRCKPCREAGTRYRIERAQRRARMA